METSNALQVEGTDGPDSRDRQGGALERTELVVNEPHPHAAHPMPYVWRDSRLRP